MSFTEVHVSRQLAECDQRAFVLKAVNIPSLVVPHEGDFILLVAEREAAAAVEHLRLYDRESRPAPIIPALPLHDRAWIAATVYAAVLLIVAWLAGRYAWGIDWIDAGALNHRALTDHEWWRPLTALTLHADIGHLLGNLAFGSVYAYFAAQLIGAGRALLYILFAAILGNILDLLLMSDAQTTLGASTAVFAMLGLVAMYSWRAGQRQHTPTKQKWAHRWAPLIAAVALLGITGAGGERTDVVAHAMGFASGAGFGLLHGTSKHFFFDRGQLVAGLVGVGLITIAWLTAISGAMA